MSHLYSATNHDWDLTLRAAWCLLMTGQAVKHLPTPGTEEEKRFSCFTGSMLLSFSTIESFSASVAFSMPQHERFQAFDFKQYCATKRFWGKLEMLCAAIPYTIDRSQGLFQSIGEMQQWRNLVAHASPYEIEETPIGDPLQTPKLHTPFHSKEYTRKVSLKCAQKFYTTAYDYIVLIKTQTGIDPRASATYVVGSTNADAHRLSSAMAKRQ